MTQDEIIEMARQAHFNSKTWVDIFVDNPTVGDVRNYLIAFAKLVAAKERKEICGTVQQIVPITNWAHELLEAIRARGEQA